MTRATFASACLFLAVLATGCGPDGAGPTGGAQGYEEARALAALRAGQSAERRGDVEAAIGHFSRAVRMDALTPAPLAETLYRRGLALAKIGRRREAIADFRAALGLVPDHVMARHALERLGGAP